MHYRVPYHRWLRAALLVALCVAAGYLFVAIPNVEMFTAAVFVAGYLCGPGLGVLIGAISALLFFLFNPYGASPPPLLAAQIISISLVGWTGGKLQKSDMLVRPPWARAALFGATGFVLTLMYDVLTTLSFALFLADGVPGKIWAIFIAGSFFSGLHLLSNSLIFALLLPLLLERLRRITLR